MGIIDFLNIHTFISTICAFRVPNIWRPRPRSCSSLIITIQSLHDTESTTVLTKHSPQIPRQPLRSLMSHEVSTTLIMTLINNRTKCSCPCCWNYRQLLGVECYITNVSTGSEEVKVSECVPRPSGTSSIHSAILSRVTPCGPGCLAS